MALLQTIRDDALRARKDRNALEATLLVTLVGEAARIGKDQGNRESTDAEVQKVVRKFLKNNAETIKALPEGERMEQYRQERGILSRYAEPELSADEVKAEIGLMGEVGPKDMGRVMGILNQKFAGRIDGKVVAEVLKAKA